MKTHQPSPRKARPLLVIATSLFAVLGEVSQAGVLYECDLKTPNNNGWVSPKMAIVFEDGGGTTVIDAVILNFVGNPIPVRASKRGNNARLTWTIANAEDDKGQSVPTFSYVAQLNMATSAISVTANPVRFPQRFSGKGTCKSRKK